MVLAAALFALAGFAFAEDPATNTSQTEHVPPDPPQSQVHDMPYREMAAMMGMDDRRRFGKVMLDRLEWRDAEPSAYEWDLSAWYGGDFNKLWIEAEGEHGNFDEARLELLWDHIATAWWSTRLGVRQDLGDGPARSWLAFGVAGMTPGFIELEATAYVGDGGRTALRLAADYDLLLSQRLVLHPEAEINSYSEGFSDAMLGLRLRYEFRREVAPYVGASWSHRPDEDLDEIALVAGIRLWF